jgi:hypothetical protein
MVATIELGAYVHIGVEVFVLPDGTAPVPGHEFFEHRGLGRDARIIEWVSAK